jgi:SAM-dependent methyltransferase
VTESLVSRYGPRDLEVFTPAERARFGDTIDEDVAWQLLYRLEPDLYERLITGERIHPDVLDWLPHHVHHCVEVAAGSGRLTRVLQPRCDRLIAVEPAAPLRERLCGVDARDGFFDALPVSDDWADLVISCSALTKANGGEAGLDEMERVARHGGMIALVWPSDVDWLRARGFEYRAFPGDMAIEFGSKDEAVAIARIFYPHAVDRIDSATVPYDVIGVNAPRDVAWKIVA